MMSSSEGAGCRSAGGLGRLLRGAVRAADAVRAEVRSGLGLAGVMAWPVVDALARVTGGQHGRVRSARNGFLGQASDGGLTPIN